MHCPFPLFLLKNKTLLAFVMSLVPLGKIFTYVFAKVDLSLPGGSPRTASTQATVGQIIFLIIFQILQGWDTRWYRWSDSWCSAQYCLGRR